jgi:hypothetical protein
MKYIFHILFAVIVATLILAQPELLSAQGIPGFPEDPPQVPIDGGLGLLAAAGGAYALNKLRKKRGSAVEE